MGKEVHSGLALVLWVAFFVGATLALIAGGYWYYRTETERIRTEKYQELAAIGKLKAGQIQAWRQERLGDVRRSSKAPFFGQAVQDWIQHPANKALQTKIQDRLLLEQKEHGYADVLLLDTECRILMSADPHPHPLSSFEEETIKQALVNGTTMLSDLYRCPLGMVHIDAVGPILGTDGRPVAVLVLRSNAESLLYPLIQSWPTPSRTAETLLVRRVGEQVLFLNDLRHRPDSALSLSESLKLQDLPAVQAVLGKRGAFLGKDYRGHEVLADLRPIPDSPWFMVAKLDSSEILAEARYRGGVVLVFVALFILLAASITAYGYRYRQVRVYRDLYRSERERRAAQEEFRMTLYSIGDAVITTDTGALVKQMNPVAEHLTGWFEVEARGKRLEEVFHIVNEETRAAAENPVQRVLREGKVEGLANHTVLISKHQLEYPIADSGAPIRDKDGTIIGVVLVFRDQTAERAEQKELHRQYEELEKSQRHAAFLAELIERSSQPLGVGYPDGRLGIVNEAFCKLTGYSKGELARTDWASALTPPEWREIEISKLEELNRTGQPVRYEKEYIRKDGTRVPIELLTHLARDENGAPQYYYAFVNDITERKRAEQRIEHLNRVLRSIREVNQLIVQEKNPDRLIQEACKLLIDNQGYSSALIIITDEAYTPRSFAEAGIGDSFEKLIERLNRGELPPCCEETRFRAGVYLVTDPSKVCAPCPLSANYASSISLCVRLRHEEKTYGYLAASVPHGIACDDEELLLFAEVADDIAFALRNIELAEQTSRSSEALRLSEA